ncbi:MAG: F0F1 ATP synthase subunit B [Patescibacteria group bacterium]
MSEILASLGFDWRVALANLVNFLIILFILKKFAFEPIKKTLTERQNKIERGLEDAQRAASELQTAEISRDKTLIEARVEANKIISEAVSTSTKIITEAKQMTDEKQKEIITRAKEVIESEKQKMLVEVREDVIKTVILATEKLIGKKLDSADDQKIIKELLK